MSAAAREDLQLLKTATSDGTIRLPDSQIVSTDITPHANGGVFTHPVMLGNQLFGEAGDEILMPLDKYLDNIGNDKSGQNVVINIDATGASEGVEQNIRMMFEEMGSMILEQAVDAAMSIRG